VIPDKQKSILQISMAAPNFTGDGHQKILEDFACSPGLTTARPVDIYFSFILFSVRYRIFGECPDPNCSSQGVFTSSTIQTLASQPCNN